MILSSPTGDSLGGKEIFQGQVKVLAAIVRKRIYRSTKWEWDF